MISLMCEFLKNKSNNNKKKKSQRKKTDLWISEAEG